jgi:hypothetical protein
VLNGKSFAFFLKDPALSYFYSRGVWKQDKQMSDIWIFTQEVGQKRPTGLTIEE